MSRLLKSEYRLSANRIKEHPKSAAKPSRYQTRQSNYFPTVGELQLHQPISQFSPSTPTKRQSLSRISPEKKFLLAIDTARFDLVNKKGNFSSNLDMQQSSPLIRSNQSRRSINRNAFRITSNSNQKQQNQKYEGPFRITNNEPARSIAPAAALSLSPKPSKKIMSTAQSQEVYGLRFLSPRRANQEAVLSLNGSAQKIESLLGKANQLQSQETMGEFSSKTGFKPDKNKIKEKIQNRIKQRISQQLFISDDNYNRAIRRMEKLEPKFIQPQKPQQILSQKLKSFGQQNTSQTAVGMSFATDFQAFNNFKQFINKQEQIKNSSNKTFQTLLKYDFKPKVENQMQMDSMKTPEKAKTNKFEQQNSIPIRAKGSNLGLQMNIHMMENFIEHKPKRQAKKEEIQDEHKLALINYEKKLLNEKKVTQSSKSIEKIQQIEESVIEDMSMNEPEEEEPEPMKESSFEDYIRPTKEISIEIPEQLTIIPPPVEDIVDIEYDQVLNFGVQRIYEELYNKFKFRNTSDARITWSISIAWPEKKPARFTFSETEGELEPGQWCILNIQYFLKEIEFYQGDLTLIIDQSRVVIPVFTGGKSNILIEPDKIELSNLNNPQENANHTFKVRNNNPFEVYFCWMYGPDAAADKNRLEYLTMQTKKMVNREKAKAIRRAQAFNDDEKILEEKIEQIKKKEKTIIEALKEFSKLFYNQIFVIIPNKGVIYPNDEQEFSVNFKPKAQKTYKVEAWLQSSKMIERLPIKLEGVGVIPKAKLSSNDINLGDIIVNQKIEFTLFIENDGEIDCPWKLNLYSSPFGSKFRFSKIKGTLQINGNKRDTIKVEFCSDITGSFEETFRITLIGTEKRLRLVLKGNVKPQVDGMQNDNQIINLEQTCKTLKSIDTFMSNDREDESSNQSDNDDVFGLQEFNNQLLNLQQSQRRLNHGCGRRKSIKSGSIGNGLKNICIEPKSMSGGNQSTTMTNSSYKDLEIDHQISKMIEEKEQCTETESQKYFKMTTKSCKNINLDFINNTSISKHDTQNQNHTQDDGFAESQDENETYNWSQGDSEEKENLPENVRQSDHDKNQNDKPMHSSNNTSSLQSLHSDSALRANTNISKFKDNDRKVSISMQQKLKQNYFKQHQHLQNLDRMHFNRQTCNISVIKEEQSPNKLSNQLESTDNGKLKSYSRKSTYNKRYFENEDDKATTFRNQSYTFQIKPQFTYMKQKSQNEGMFQIQEKRISMENFEKSSESQFDNAFNSSDQRFNQSEQQILKSKSDQQLQISDGNSQKEQDKLFQKHIRMNENIQIFNSPYDMPMNELKIFDEKFLGQGTQGRAFRVQIEGLDGYFVDKVTQNMNNSEKAIKDIKEQFTEFQIGIKVYHENIIKYKYFMRQYDPQKKKHETHLILEYCDGGNLNNFITINPRLSIKMIQQIGGQMISGINHLHKSKIIHQDIKPGNIMLTSDRNQVKIIDMGVSHTLDRTFLETMSARLGTQRYMAPEQSHDRICLQSDIWSFGCVLLELCTGNQPYHGVSLAALIRQIENENPLEFALRSFSDADLLLLRNQPDLIEILERCFIRNERQRPHAESIMSYTFFKNDIVTWAK